MFTYFHVAFGQKDLESCVYIYIQCIRICIYSILRFKLDPKCWIARPFRGFSQSTRSRAVLWARRKKSLAAALGGNGETGSSTACFGDGFFAHQHLTGRAKVCFTCQKEGAEEIKK